ncbi:N-acyl-phosphatidylethanolamine-hydrolyzing phospholipase D, mitochondrial [Colletotrichum sp. SAR 10_86]|nr:N-acyl-phosphatidylethanolamine-hydrolyzing phospholipase D, mitochondrial [Colletotrichum sp. SAR 10_86]
MAETQPKTTGETSREDVLTPHDLTARGEPASMFDVQAGAFGNIQDRAKVTPASEDGSLDGPSGLQAQAASVNLTEVNYTADGTRLHAGVDRGKGRAPSIDPYYTSSSDARGIRQQPAAPASDAHLVSTGQLMGIIKQLTESHLHRSTPITMNPFQNENAPLFTGDNIMDFIETYDSWSREARWTDEDKLTKEAAKAALVYQYSIADESFYQDPNKELRAIEDEPPLSETDTVGITALFNRIEGLRYKATVRELPEYRDQDLVRLICRRLPKGAIKAAAKALSCDIKDLLQKPWPSVKRAVIKWVAGETSYAYISGRKTTKVAAPPPITSLIKPNNQPAQVAYI